MTHHRHCDDSGQLVIAVTIGMVLLMLAGIFLVAPPLGAATDLSDRTRTAAHATAPLNGVFGTAQGAVVAVHGVRRVQGGTVVYFSTGGAPGAETSVQPIDITDSRTFQPGTGLAAGPDVRLAIPGRGLLLLPVFAPESLQEEAGDLFTSQSSDFSFEKGVLSVLYAVLPPLPDDVDVVDVVIANTVLPDIPVEEGFLQPSVDTSGTSGIRAVLLGQGFPMIGLSDIADVSNGEASIFALDAVTLAPDGASATTQTGEQVSLDVAADVAFATDSADVQPAAVTTLDGIAAQLRERRPTGRISIIGHTDSRGDAAYNQDLSLRRAQAVADALNPAIDALALDVTVEGRGESEPIADNDTDEGRQANRRVAISFATGEGAS